MKRAAGLLTTVVALFFCFASLTYASDAYEYVNWVDASGTFLHAANERETTVSTFVKFREVVTEGMVKQLGHFLCRHNDIQLQVPIAEIRSIKVAEKPKAFARNPYPSRVQALVLTMKNGKSFNVTVEKDMGFSLANYEYIEFKYFSPISNRFEYGGVLGDKLREIRFD